MCMFALACPCLFLHVRERSNTPRTLLNRLHHCRLFENNATCQTFLATLPSIPRTPSLREAGYRNEPEWLHGKRIQHATMTSKEHQETPFQISSRKRRLEKIVGKRARRLEKQYTTNPSVTICTSHEVTSTTITLIDNTEEVDDNE